MEPMFSKYPGSPWDEVPDAPEFCVVCSGNLPEDAGGVIIGYADDGCTCSENCHQKWIQDQEEHRKAEQEASIAFAEHCAEMARMVEEGQ